MYLDPVWRIDEHDNVAPLLDHAPVWLRDYVASLLAEGLPLPQRPTHSSTCLSSGRPGAIAPSITGPAASSWGDAQAPVDRSVVAIKGLEPATPFIADLLADFQAPSNTPNSIAGHLVLEERNVPGAVLLSEAEREAQAAVSVQLEHVAQYGTLARLPLPLLILRHHRRHEEALLALLETQLPKHERTLAVDAVATGLAVVVYHYPAPPLRVRDLDGLLFGMGLTERQLAFLGAYEIDVDRLAGGWTQLFTRMLLLGFVPGNSPPTCGRVSAAVDQQRLSRRRIRRPRFGGATRRGQWHRIPRPRARTLDAGSH